MGLCGKISLFSLIFVFSGVCLSVSGCPPAEDIKPCKCFESAAFIILQCMGVNDDAALRRVFRNSENYKYQEVHFYFSTLKYLPHEMFTHTEVHELYFANSTLTALFDSPPEELHNLYKLKLENTNIIEVSKWNLFKPLTELRILTIYYNIIKTLDSTLDQYVTTNLQQLILYGTETSKIEPGALNEFVNLDRLSIDGCKLTELSRNMFPRPFKVQHLYFDDNEIQAIPGDLFIDMPKLLTVGLRKNYLTVIPESAFDGNVAKFNYLMLDGNPIRCDCKLLWLIKNKPGVLKGTCATPIRLHDRELNDLQPKDFKC